MTPESQEEAPGPGWYPDPVVPGGSRYWDGTRWTSVSAAAPVAAKTGTNTLAVVSFITSFLGIWIVGLVLGYMALGQIRRNPGEEGRGLAIAGVVLGWIGLIATVILIIVLVSAANEDPSPYY